MTIKELIEQLKKYPESTTIETCVYGENINPIKSEDVYVRKNHRNGNICILSKIDDLDIAQTSIK